MLTNFKALMLSFTILFSSAAFQQNGIPAGPEYTRESQPKLPEHYREWVYLSTGFDMSYNPPTQTADHHMLANVFVNPEAYKRFLQTVTWPYTTMYVLETRGTERRRSIKQ